MSEFFYSCKVWEEYHTLQHEFGNNSDLFFRYGEEQPSGMEGEFGESLIPNYPKKEFGESSPNYAANAEAEASSLGSRKQVGAPLVEDTNQQMHDELADDLSDFGDDATTPVASPKDAVLRRKMRMVLDLEDDD